jgi:preprotein translocase subunit YajC
MKNQRIISFSILILISLFLFNISNALIIYLRPPKMFIRVNTSETVERSLVIENRNNISMNINATMGGNISKVITIDDPVFEILPNETKTVDFVTNANNPGIYSGQILVTYSTGKTELITLSSDITVTAIKNQESNKNIPETPTLIIIIIVSVIVVSVFLLKRGGV